MTADEAGGGTATLAAEEPAPPEQPSLLRNRSFQALWSSEALSGIGENSAGIAYPLLVLASTGSAAYAGAVGSAQLLSNGLMSFWGGVLADRVDRRKLLIVCNVVRAALLGLFSLLIFAGPVNVFITFGVAIVSGGCYGLSIPTGMAMVKQLVRPDQVAQATAQNQVRWFGAITAGPSIGGVLYGVSRALPFLGGCVSFAVSAFLTLFVRSTPLPTDPQGKKGLFEGFRYLTRDPVLRPLMVSITLSNLAFNTVGMSLAVIATGKERGASDSFIGLTLSVAGAGALVGALLAGPITKRLRPSTVFMGGYWIGPVAALLLMTVPGVIPLGIVVACVYVRGPLINALFLTYAAKTVPDELQGRVLGAIVFTSTIISPIGVLAIGAIFDAWGPVWVFAAVGAIATLAALPTLSRSIRTLTSLDTIPQ
ncbi:MFS family permease [Kitasatospora sp. MAP12-15]|uniref:MFS transporter n=1 Tax=unclassified Kitasatospora TaxID=2633591 RepID=UPI002476CB78|nr:MFS transporter [Kitasatospora sp. MAP12-44]MDH6112897.1 MFS family permease [Kitasatospora sp. MAP12-44]